MADAAGASDASAADASDHPDAARADASRADASGGADAGADSGIDAANPGNCPSLVGDGLTPGWLHGIVSQDPAAPGLSLVISADAAADCSFVIGGVVLFGDVVFGPDEPGQTAVDGDSWFIARYRADGTLDWVTDIADRSSSDEQDIRVHVMPDGSVAAVRAAGVNSSTLVRVSADGVVQGEPTLLDARIVLPLADGGVYLARNFAFERRDAAGQVLWSRVVGIPRSITPLADGRVIQAGNYDFVGITLNQGQPDELVIETNENGCYVAMYGADGSLEWARMIDLDGTLLPICRAEAGDDWLAMRLEYPSVDERADFLIWPGDGSTIEAGRWHAMVLRFEASGQLAWYRGIDALGLFGFGAQALSLAPGNGGMVTVGGVMSGSAFFQGIDAGNGVGISAGPLQAWFARYAADGQLVGAVGQASSDEPPPTSEITATATRIDGSAILAGHFTGPFALGPFELTADLTLPQGLVAEVH
jgi:hypothetical protein